MSSVISHHKKNELNINQMTTGLMLKFAFWIVGYVSTSIIQSE